ncbi:MAG: nitroreductase family protein [Desulfobacteraceae bacterium]|nr:nitroreductase family protein [Desulfobacteraceae bacterium]
MDFRQVVENRRSVNFFDPDKDVSDDLLRQIIDIAALAPSSFNLQPWSLVVLRGQEEKMRLQKHAWGQAKVSEAPVTLIVLADMKGWEPGHHFVEKNFDSMVEIGMFPEDRRDWFHDACSNLYGASQARQAAFACKNAGFFAMNLMLAARDLGVDTHPMDGFDIAGVQEEFRIPENYWIPMLIAMGHFRSDKTLLPPKWRKSFEEILVRFD